MSIDLASLGLPKAIIGKSTQPQRPYKVDPEKVKADLSEARASGEVRDLVALSGNTEAVERLKDSAQGEVQRVSNYSSDVFFNREMPDQIDVDGGYTVGGVKFSEAELQQARAVLTTAARGISAGPGRNTNLDYRNYAQMAVAEQAVNTYASGNLSEDQQRVVNGAMREYNEALVGWQDTLLGGSPETSGSEYYGRSHSLSQQEADLVNSFKAELSRLTGRSFKPSVAGDAGGYDQIATNRGLITKIGSAFAEADLTTSAGRNSALNTYAQLMRPVYQAQGITTGIDKVLSNDTASLSSLFDSILSKQHLPISLSL